ncbi:MAG: adenosylcobinamide-GDP ribazoletransferase [Candidatus Omnitrophica bacterium]|nr:adenosylcobinamide-GDP ribazoletransferase [Candidatus Omnitrophota bacterium]
MIAFLVALQFLTILPVKLEEVTQKNFSRAMIYFPVIGLLLGAILFALNSLFNFLDFSRISIDIILVVSLVALTGGMHLDGLSDSFDALLSGKKREEMLAIMRDSHAGAMGVVAIVSILFLKVGLLCSVPAGIKPLSLLLFCALSRWAMVCAIFLFPYARKEGKAAVFFDNITDRVMVVASLIIFATAALLWKINGIIALIAVALLVYLLGKSISKKMNGLTGDTLGAMNEISEAVALLAIAILGRGFA